MKVKNGSSRKAEEAKNEASKQDGMKKNLKPNSSSSEERAAENITSKQDRRLLRNLKQFRSSGEEKNSNKQNVVHKTSRRAKEVARIKISMQGACQSLKRKSPSTDKQLDNKPNISKNFKQVEVQNNLKTKHSGAEKGKECKISVQDVQKKAKPNNRSTEDDAKIRTCKQDEVLKKNQLNSPSSVSIPDFHFPIFGEAFTYF